MNLSLVVVHLTGPHRGTRQHLAGSQVRIGSGAESDFHFPGADAPAVAPLHATLRATEDGPVLEAEPGQKVFVNGEPVESRLLAPGDVLEIGTSGPLLKIRSEVAPVGPHKTVGQALQDCVDCARYGSDDVLGRARILAGGLPRELFLETRPMVRWATAGVLLVAVIAAATLAVYARRLESRIDDDNRRLATIEAAVREAQEGLDELDLPGQLSQLQDSLTGRIEALEARSEAVQRVISTAGGSVVFLQGAYTLLGPDDDRSLRRVLGPGGTPARGELGEPLVSLDGNGPPLENRFTGSAFVVGDGLLVTNRHVALPWEFDPATRAWIQRGYRPRLRMLGYVPGVPEPITVQLLRASETSDLALLQSNELGDLVAPIPLGEASPTPGTEVIVLGYPTGINALLARASSSLADSLVRASRRDFWGIARSLSSASLVRPLATRGIVGQVTAASVVYDAETTRGGSGGPVLGLDGSLLAVTVGVMVDFGGSNLGVPVEEVRRLLNP